jgi:hypothetical protein
MARSNPNIGDTIKQQYCISNPTDPFCSCINLTNKPEYILWTQAMNAKHPEIVISPLMYLDVNGYNPCRKHLTTDMQTQFIPSELIAQIGHLPTSYSISDLTVSGDNNILTDVSANVFGSTAADPSKNPPTDKAADPSKKPPTDPSESTNSYTNYMIIAFVIIVAVACYWTFADAEPVPNYVQIPYQQFNPQQLQPYQRQPYQIVRR